MYAAGESDVTLEKVLSRAGLAQERAGKFWPAWIEPLSRMRSFPLPNSRRFAVNWASVEYFKNYMMKHSKDAMPGLAGYLRQEGMLEDIPDAIVDSGWTGSMQKLLGDALSQLGRTRELEGYYWGLYELPPKERLPAYHCYFFDPGRHLQEKVYFNNCLFEAVYSAPHGMTLGYRE
ncbi:MAG: hypothetical protein ACLR23_12170 [Clostridia bacterium]